MFCRDEKTLNISEYLQHMILIWILICYNLAHTSMWEDHESTPKGWHRMWGQPKSITSHRICSVALLLARSHTCVILCKYGLDIRGEEFLLLPLSANLWRSVCIRLLPVCQVEYVAVMCKENFYHRPAYRYNLTVSPRTSVNLQAFFENSQFQASNIGPHLHSSA